MVYVGVGQEREENKYSTSIPLFFAIEAQVSAKPIHYH